MIHRWYSLFANMGNPNTPSRFSIRTGMMKGPVYVRGMYFGRGAVQNESLELGFMEYPYIEYKDNPSPPPNVIRNQPFTNGVGEFIETKAMVGGLGNGRIPFPVFTRFGSPDMLQDDLSGNGPGALLNGWPTFLIQSPGALQYVPIHQFIPRWDACLVISGTMTANAGQGRKEVCVEVIEDIFSLSPEMRDTLRRAYQTLPDFGDLFGEATLTAIQQNSLFGFASFLFGIFGGFGPGVPNPQIDDVSTAILGFTEGFV